MTIMLTSLSGKLLISIHKVLLRFLSVLSFGTHSSVSSFCSTLCFYVLDEAATSPSFEGVALCRR